MSLALTCDGPSCKASVPNTYGNKQSWVTISHKGNDKHFCSWNCAISFTNEVDVLDGFTET